MILPTRYPIWTMLALVLGLMCCAGIGKAWMHWWATPAERHYLIPYLKSEVVISKKQTVTVVGRKYPAKPLHAWLDATVYNHGEVFKAPLYVMGGVLIVALFWGAGKDRRRRKMLFEDGMRIRGPELLTERDFNKRRKGDGFQLEVIA